MRTLSRVRGLQAGAAAAILCSGLVFGVASAKTHPDSCTANCSHQYNSSMRAESGLHVANMQACGSRRSCKSAETTRHEQAVKGIQSGRDACQGHCPHS